METGLLENCIRPWSPENVISVLSFSQKIQERRTESTMSPANQFHGGSVRNQVLQFTATFFHETSLSQ